MTRRDAVGRAGSGVLRASPHPAVSDVGAAPLVPHPCFTGGYLSYVQDVGYLIQDLYMQ